uniref:Retrovirus-related Pol polyprotein from transposon TNT 1-94 n=1 Tax=Tanacetum cinerariifolium TaxID=118510 RepID=A0A699GQC5_TANCI|nr:retrovirus-related Pol polyprotein from transposon TNT 1-94 [Tanacetum cinerariifolium]
MLKKHNYVPWSSRIIRYARSRPNGKMIVDSIENGPYVRRMISTPGELDLLVLVLESFHEQTDKELTKNDRKQIDADDQANQTILLGLPEDVYATVDSCKTAKEIWERNGSNQNGLVVVLGIANQNGTSNIVAARAEGTGNGNQVRCYNFKELGHIPRNCTARPRRRDVAYLQTQLLIAQKEEARIQLQVEEFNFMAAAGDLDEIEEVNANCILMANLQHASTSGTQLDKAPVYDTDGSAEVQLNDNCYDNKIFNMFTQEEQNTDLLEHIPEPQLVPQNDNHVTSVAPSMMQSRGTVETSSSSNEETRAHQETVYRNLLDQVAQKRKRLKHDFNTWEDKFLDKEVDLKAKIKDLENILLKRDQTVQTMHMINPKPDLFYQPKQSLYHGNLLLEEHDPPDVYDLEETLKLAQESREKMRLLKKEIKSANYAKINHLLGVFIPQTTKSKEELFLSNVSNMVTVSKTISIPNEDLSDDTTPSVARKFLNEEVDESLDKQKSLELKIERLLKESVCHDIMSIVQNGFVDVPSDLQTELDRMKEKLKLCIIKKEKEYAVLWNNWYTKCEECKYDKILYDKAYNDMQQKVERLQAQLRDLKGKISDTPSASNSLDPLNQKLESKIVELEFQVVNYERKISHLKTTYKNLFDSITSNRAHAKLRYLVYENTKLRARLFKNTSESMNNTLRTSVTLHVDKPKLIAVTPHSKKFHASILSHSVPQPIEFNVMKHRLVHADRYRRPQPKGNTRNARVPYASKSSEVKKNVTVENHRRTLLLSKNQKTMSSECNNIRLAIRNDKSEIICGTCKQCLVTTNHDACLLSPVNALNSHANNLYVNASPSAKQKRHKTQVVQICLWCVDSGCSKHMTGNIKLLINFEWKFLGTVRFGNDHIAAILGYGDLKWGNITITRVYFVKGLGHNLFLVGQFCDADLEVAFRRNTCFIRDMDGVDLLKGNCSTNLYTINLYKMASASPICLIAHATPTKSWLWHQRLSYLNIDTINDLAKNDLVSGLPKFKYAKEHLCPSCEQGKSKRASHPPKPILNSKQRLHLLHMDLCGPMRVASINEVIKNFLKKIYVRLQAPIIIVRTDNETKFKNHVLKKYFDSVGITYETSAAKTP